jgi:hypothetical protein
MKKSIFMTLAAVVVCGLAVTLFTQCNKNKNPEVTMAYYVSVSPDVLNVADVEINYLDANGAQQKEVLTDSTWRKPITTNTLPLTEGVWAKLTPKASIADGNYQLRIQTVASIAAILSDGTKVYDGWTNNNNEVITTAQNADEVAAWCAQSPTIALTINKEGVSSHTQVDFGGNCDYDPENLNKYGCTFFCDWFGWDWWCEWCEENGY